MNEINRCDCCEYITTLKQFQVGPGTDMENLCAVCSTTYISNVQQSQIVPRDKLLYTTIAQITNLLIDSLGIRPAFEQVTNEQQRLDLEISPE